MWPGLSNAPFCRLRRLGEEEAARTRYCIPQMRGLALRHRASRPLPSPLCRALESPVNVALLAYHNVSITFHRVHKYRRQLRTPQKSPKISLDSGVCELIGVWHIFTYQKTGHVSAPEQHWYSVVLPRPQYRHADDHPETVLLETPLLTVGMLHSSNGMEEKGKNRSV